MKKHANKVSKARNDLRKIPLSTTTERIGTALGALWISISPSRGISKGAIMPNIIRMPPIAVSV